MPCTLCNQTGHNRRTCTQFSILELIRQQYESLIGEPTQEDSPPTNTSIDTVYTPSSYSTSWSEFDIPAGDTATHIRECPTHPDRTFITPHSLRTQMLSPIPFPSLEAAASNHLHDFENIDLENIFGDGYNSIPGLEPITTKTTILTDCVEEPCKTNDCPICMDDLHKTDLFVSRCGHQFHSTCMIRHMKKNDNCPMCRGVLFTTTTV